MYLNKVTIIGRTGSDPKTMTFNTGTEIARLTVAVGEKYKDRNGETVETTEWFNVVFFEKLAGVVSRFVKKGMLVYVEGKLKTRQYESNGEKKQITELIADRLLMLESLKNNQDKQQNSNTGSPDYNAKQEYPIEENDNIGSDGLPF